MLTHRWQTGLSFIGIALGVAIVIAVDLANESARKAFNLSLTAITGQISHQIIANSNGLDEHVFVLLRTELGIDKSAPQVLAHVKYQGESFSLAGIDPISEYSLQRQHLTLDKGIVDLAKQANGVVLLAQTAQRLGLKTGDSFSVNYLGKTLLLTLRATFNHPNGLSLGGIIFTDIANAQHILQRPNKIDRIDLNISHEQAQAIQHWLPKAYRLIDAQARQNGLVSMSKAFHTNLTAMSLLALLVGALLIYNTMHFSALRRQPLMGTYRAIGVTQWQLLVLLLSEAFTIAILASIAGTIMGVLLSQYLVQLVTQTVNDLYFSLTVNQFFLSPWSLIKGVFLGVATSLIATLLPAIHASQTPPISLQRRSETEQKWRQRYGRLALIGLIGLLAGYLYNLMPSDSLVNGFISLAMMVIGFCLLVPALLNISCQWLDQQLPSWATINTRLAIRGLVASISRTGIAVAALSVALATVIGVTIMISSFRYSVSTWLTQSLRGDIYVSIPGSSRQSHNTGIPASLIESLRQLDGVLQLSTLQTFYSESDAGRLRTISISPLSHPPPLLDHLEHAYERYANNEGIFISEPLAYHQQLNAGDLFRLYTQQGVQTFTILGVFRDYSSSQGVVSLPPQLLKTFWQPIAINGIFINRTPSYPQEQLVAAIRKTLTDYPQHFRLSANQAIKDRSLTIFDRTFAITHVLRLLVLIVAFTGLLSALLALQLEKSREYAILKATGMSHRQMAGLILQQTTLLGLIAAILALPLGILLANQLIHVINRRSFGWSMEQIFPPEMLSDSFMLAISASLLAAIYPIWVLKKKAIAPSLREE